MAFEIIALVTNEGKKQQATALAEGIGFQVKYFSLGDQGHDQSDTTIALSPNPSDTECNGGNAVLFGPKAVSGFVYTGSYCPTFICEIGETDFVGSISQLCLIGEIVWLPPLYSGTAQVGDQYLFGIANMPMWPKTDMDSREWFVSLQY